MEGLVLEATFWGEPADGGRLRAVPDGRRRLRAAGDRARRTRPGSTTGSGSSAVARSHALSSRPTRSQLGRAGRPAARSAAEWYSGVVGAADPRRGHARHDERLVVAGRVDPDDRRDPQLGRRPARARRARRWRCSLNDDSGTAPPTPTRSRETIAAQVARSSSGHLGDVELRPEVVQVAGPDRLLGAERDQHDLPVAAQDPAELQEHRDARRVVLGARRDRDRVEVRADQPVRLRPGRSRAGVATTLSDRPASTGTPQESPAGTGNDCRRTSYPAGESSVATYDAASRNAAPGRQPRPDPAGQVAATCAPPARPRTRAARAPARRRGGRGRLVGGAASPAGS